MDTSFVWSMIFLFGVGIFIAIMQKIGRMTANRFALISVAYLSYFVISAFHADPDPLSPSAIRSEIIILFGIWFLGYPMARWIYGQWHSRDH